MILLHKNDLSAPAIQLILEANLAWEQALRGALAAGREKEGELTTTPLEFEYLHQKSRCEMLIGGDDISNDVITLGTCFSMFVYIRARFRFALIGGNLTAQSTGSYMGIGGGIQIPETKFSLTRRKEGEKQRPELRLRFAGYVVASSPSFSHAAARAPRRA